MTAYSYLFMWKKSVSVLTKPLWYMSGFCNVSNFTVFFDLFYSYLSAKGVSFGGNRDVWSARRLTNTSFWHTTQHLLRIPLFFFDVHIHLSIFLFFFAFDWTKTLLIIINLTWQRMMGKFILRSESLNAALWKTHLLSNFLRIF